jgi:hypothetical protein
MRRYTRAESDGMAALEPRAAQLLAAAGFPESAWDESGAVWTPGWVVHRGPWKPRPRHGLPDAAAVTVTWQFGDGATPSDAGAGARREWLLLLDPSALFCGAPQWDLRTPARWHCWGCAVRRRGSAGTSGAPYKTSTGGGMRRGSRRRQPCWTGAGGHWRPRAGHRGPVGAVRAAGGPAGIRRGGTAWCARAGG